MCVTAFSTIAEYYEALTNSEKRLAREGPLLLQWLSRAPGKRVLDIACGTGLHALFFAERGANVTAVDLSESMVAYARTHRPHTAIRYLPADMRRLPDGAWDLAVCLGNSLSLLQEDSDLALVFAQVAARLVPGGIFLTQTLNYETETAREPRYRVERVSSSGAQVIAVKNLVPCGPITLLALQFFAECSGEWQHAAEWGILRHWTRRHLAMAAETAGLQEEAVFGGFDAGPYDACGSSDIVCVFRNPEDVRTEPL